MPFGHNSNHCALVAKICAGGGEGDGKVPEAVSAFPPQDPPGTPYRACEQVRGVTSQRNPPPREGAPRQPMDIG
jgi:hypothetical protein